MIQARPLAALIADLIRRPPPPACEAEAEAARPSGGWRDDLRFFAQCYLAGLAFFFAWLA